MPEQNTPFADTIRRLHEANIRFVLIGGVAMGAHGSSYLTTDVDFAYAADAENVERLAAFLTAVRARVAGRPVGDGFVVSPVLLQQVRFLNLSTNLGAIPDPTFVKRLLQQVVGVVEVGLFTAMAERVLFDCADGSIFERFAAR